MKETTKIVFGLIIGSAIIAVGLYFGLKEGLKEISTSQTSVNPQSSNSTNITPLPSNTPTLQPTSTSLPTPTSAEITWIKSDIIKALSQKTNIAEDKIRFSIGEKVKKENKVLIKGTVSKEGEIGGAGFFGVINQNGVNITYTGQGTPSCSEVNPYGYPLSWADYCINSSGQTIHRQ